MSGVQVYDGNTERELTDKMFGESGASSSVATGWICAVCGTSNNPTNKSCDKCSGGKDSTYQEVFNG